jgi:putative aldouronate transport system substrate-binding protein
MVGIFVFLTGIAFVFTAGSLLTACRRSESSAAAQVSGTDGKPAYAEITVEVFDRGTDGGRSDPTDNNWTKWIQEKVLEDENIGVTFIRVPRSDENTALNNLMAAGNSPDVCLTYSGELIGYYRDLGGLYDLASYADTLLADLKDFLGPDQALPGRDFIRRNQDIATGKMYSIPARRMNTARLGTFIRKDWLDTLGLSLPKTTQEFYDALAAFKEKDPGGVGAGKVVPFTLAKNVWWRAGNLLDSFIDPSLSDQDRWVNTIVDRSYLLPGYKEGVRFLNTMYNAGLVDRDFPLYASDDPGDNLFKSGIVGAYISNWDQVYRDTPGILRDLQKNVSGAELVPIDPFTAADGKTAKGAYDAAGLNFFIPASCKNLEAALRYINWLARFENRLFLQIGPEGVIHDVVDNIPKLKSASGLWIQNSPQNIDYTIMINGLDLGDPAKTAQGLANSYNVDPALIVSAYDMAMNNARAGIVVPVTLSAAGPYVQVLVDKGDTLMAETITCPAAQFDRVWDAGIADWLASGAQAILNERAAKYAAPR